MNVIARLLGGPAGGTDREIESAPPSIRVEKNELVSTVPFKTRKSRGRYIRDEYVIYRWAGWEDEGTVDEQPSDPVGVGPLAVEGD